MIPSNEEVFLTIKCEDPTLLLCFPCKKNQQKQYTVNIPALNNFLKEGSYTFCVDVKFDGYHLTGFTGKLSLEDGIESTSVKVSNIKPTNQSTVDKQSPKLDEKQKDITKTVKPQLEKNKHIATKEDKLENIKLKDTSEKIKKSVNNILTAKKVDENQSPQKVQPVVSTTPKVANSKPIDAPKEKTIIDTAAIHEQIQKEKKARQILSDLNSKKQDRNIKFDF